MDDVDVVEMSRNMQLQRDFNMSSEQVTAFCNIMTSMRQVAVELDVVHDGLDYLFERLRDNSIFDALVRELIELDFPHLCVQIFRRMEDALEADYELLIRLLGIMEVLAANEHVHQELLLAEGVRMCLSVLRAYRRFNSPRDYERLRVVRGGSMQLLLALVRNGRFTYEQLREIVHVCCAGIVMCRAYWDDLVPVMEVLCTDNVLVRLLFLDWSYIDQETAEIRFLHWYQVRSSFDRGSLAAMALRHDAVMRMLDNTYNDVQGDLRTALWRRRFHEEARTGVSIPE